LADRGVLADPHVVVGISGAARQSVQEAIERDGLQRQIDARLSEFARSDHMGTFAPIGVAEAAVTFGPAFMVPTIGIPRSNFKSSGTHALRTIPRSSGCAKR
jgi:hypothetical protein